MSFEYRRALSFLVFKYSVSVIVSRLCHMA